MTSTTIHTLRLRTAPGREARSRQAALRHRASAWLSMPDLHPPDLPPAAILHVRRLPDPVVYASNASGGLRPSLEWQQAVRSVMEERLQEAKKPVRGLLPASAEAVVFANVAEQIASLSLDLVYGRVMRRWWWTPVLEKVGGAAQSPGQRLARVLAHDPDATPVVIAYLAEWGHLGTVLPVTSPLEAEWVLRAWTPRHGVSVPSSPMPASTGSSTQAWRASSRKPASAPWGADIDRALPRGLSRVHRALAGVALARLRTPHRSGTLSRDLERWWEQREERSAANAPRQGTPDGGPFPPKAGRPEGDRFTNEAANADLSGRDRGRGQALKQVYEENPELQKGSPLNQHAGDSREEAAPCAVGGAGAENREFDTNAKGPPKAPTAQAAAPPETAGTRPQVEDSTHTPHRHERSAEEFSDAEQVHRAPKNAKPTDAKKEPDSATSDEDEQHDSGKTSVGGSEAATEEDASSACADSAASSPDSSPVGSSARRSEETSAEEPSEYEPRASDETPWRPMLETRVFATALGGAIYLVNLLKGLGWTGLSDEGDATEFARRVRGEARPWAALDAVARGLIGTCLPPVRRLYANAFTNVDPWADGLWTTLAVLDGRPDTTPAGTELQDMSAFVAPPEALAQVEPQGAQASWCVSGGRLRVGTDRCLWADLPAPVSNPSETAAALIQHLGAERYKTPREASPEADPFGSTHAPIPSSLGLSPALRQWLQCALPLVLARLRQVLGAESFADALAECLLVPATVHLEPMHLDVTLPLDAISLPIRLAGLDQSPGWAPGFGKVIRIHFR